MIVCRHRVGKCQGHSVEQADSVPSIHEPIEEGHELPHTVERQNMRDVLVRPHDHHAALFAFDAAHSEDITAAFQVGAKHLFVVA